MTSWICAHLGAREHYAVPRALHRLGRLRLVVVDAWSRPSGPMAHLPGDLARRLAERYHPDLETADVRDLTFSLLKTEMEFRWQRRTGWDLTIARNDWFQREAAATIREYEPAAGDRVAVFAHSYAAREIFKAARSRGWLTILGQIDPGEEHFAIARGLEDRSPQYGPPTEAPPINYFESWREECALADRIVVNSKWSKTMLLRGGIPEEKLSIIPLAYDGAGAPPAARDYPERFTDERKLRLLFVGSASVVKGVPQLLEAMAQLSGLPVTLQIVGEPAMRVPDAFIGHPSIEWVGAVPRGDMPAYYQANDVLLFPSHSDGFGMAQIEAQQWRLPVIASTHCGDVVIDGENGVLLTEVSGRAIASAVLRLLNRPSRLEEFSKRARTGADGFAALGPALTRLAASMSR